MQGSGGGLVMPARPDQPLQSSRAVDGSESGPASWATQSGLLQLVEWMPTAVLLLDEDTRVLFRNRAARVLREVLRREGSAGPHEHLRDWHPDRNR